MKQSVAILCFTVCAALALSAAGQTIEVDLSHPTNHFVPSGAVEISTFGSGQYQWHPPQTRFMAHAEENGKPTIATTTKGWADPDGPIVHSKLRETLIKSSLSTASIDKVEPA